MSSWHYWWCTATSSSLAKSVNTNCHNMNIRIISTEKRPALIDIREIHMFLYPVGFLSTFIFKLVSLILSFFGHGYFCFAFYFHVQTANSMLLSCLKDRLGLTTLFISCSGSAVFGLNIQRCPWSTCLHWHYREILPSDLHYQHKSSPPCTHTQIPIHTKITIQQMLTSTHTWSMTPSWICVRLKQYTPSSHPKMMNWSEKMTKY